MFQEYETLLWALQIHKTRSNLLVSFFSSSLDQNNSENLQPSVGSHQPKVSQQTQPNLSSQGPTCTKVGGQTSDGSKPGSEGDGQLLSPSQDIQTLQDLVDLAREGLTLTQWNLDSGHVEAAEQPGEFWQLCEPCPGSFSCTEPGCDWAGSQSHSSTHRLLVLIQEVMLWGHIFLQWDVDTINLIFLKWFINPIFKRIPGEQILNFILKLKKSKYFLPGGSLDVFKSWNKIFIPAYLGHTREVERDFSQGHGGLASNWSRLYLD